MNNIPKSTIIVTIALLFCVGFIFSRFSFPPTIEVSGESKKNIVTTNGEGVIKVTPDMAIITLGVESQNKNLEAAYKENKGKMEALLKELKALGVDEKDIQTSGFNVNPTYNWENNKNQIIGYTVNNQVNVKVRKIEDTGKILESSVLKEANAIHGLAFTLSDDSQAYEEALALAVKNAEAKAGVLLKNTDEKKLVITAIRENSTNISEPIYLEKRAMDTGSGAAPISTGTLEVRASVAVDFQF